MGERDDRFHDDDHGFPSDALFHIIDVFDHVLGQSFLAVVDVPAITALDQIIIVRGVVHRGLVGNAVGEDLGVEHLEDVFIHQVLRVIAESLALPFLYDLAEFQLFFFAAESQVVRRTFVEGVEVLIEPSCDIRMHDRVVPAAALMAGDLGIFVDEDLAVFEVITESLRAP